MNITLREVRPSDADALGHILVTANNANYRGIVPEQCLNFTEAQSSANWKRSLDGGLGADEKFYIAADDLDAVAYAWGGPSADDPVYRGELKQINVLPTHQRRGIGRLLVGAIAQHLAGLDICSMRVEALRCNPCCAFYERLGATYVSQRLFDWDGVSMPMCKYGWKDTRRLIGMRIV